jgi:hypothetical protein
MLQEWRELELDLGRPDHRWYSKPHAVRTREIRPDGIEFGYRRQEWHSRTVITADPPPPAHTPPAEEVEIGRPAETARRALWRRAGLRRDPDGLRQLLADQHPLARLIAASCLARAESRGAHQRTDAPETDPALDCMHTLVGAGAEPRFERWT